MNPIPLTIIGGGIIGCALAYELSQSIDDIVLLEQQPSLRAENQSSRNSGVIHAGIYYDPRESPLKAQLCVEGNALLYEFCRKNQVLHKRTGKLVIASNPLDEEYLEEIVRIAAENNVAGLEQLSMSKVRALEPNIAGTAALYVHSSGIIDPIDAVTRLARNASVQGAIILPGNKVVKIKPRSGSFEITTLTPGQKPSTFITNLVINAAGLYADEIARMVNPSSLYEILPVRGESARFYRNRRLELYTNGLNIYPAPYIYYNHTGEPARVSLAASKRLLQEGKATKTVGIHLTPTFNAESTIGSTVTIGPAKTVGLGKEDYSSHLKSPSYYRSRVHHFFPGLQKDDIELHQAGIMAVLKGSPDWVIERDHQHPHCINVMGIDSPGLTACLAIARYVKQMILYREMR